MGLKYYLRGLGLGIIITAVIMEIAYAKKQMTDEQVRERARELGMIESTVLAGEPKDNAETEDDAEDDSKENVSVEILESGQAATDEKDIDRIKQIQAAADVAGTDSDTKNAAGNTENAGDSAADTDTDAEIISDNEGDMSANTEGTASEDDIDTGTTEGEAEAAEENVPVSSGSFTVTINSGDGSDTASRKLAAAGVVSSASNYDDFLCANGYDKRIRPGTYSIPANASDEQIARIITGQE